MSSLHIDFAAALGLVMLLALLAFGAALFFYRTTVPPVSRARRALLIALRTAAVGLIAILLCEPVLHLSFSHTTPPVLAVVVDNSRSMRIVDRTGDRAALLREALRDPVLSRLAGRAQVRFYTFGARLRPWQTAGTDTLRLDEGVTDLSGALQGLGEEKQRRQVDAALLLSDGTYTLGRDPLHDAEQLGLPLFTVGLGDSSEQKDILVTRIAANELVYAGTRAPVSVTVKSAGFGGERVEVTLSAGGRVVDRAPLTLEEGTREYTVDLSSVPEGEGTRRYTAAVSTLDGELTGANNRRSFTARVLRSKLRILVLAARPSPDVPVVAQTLREEPNFAVLSFTADAAGGFYEGTVPRAALDSADCYVLIGLPPASASPAVPTRVAERAAAQKIPVFFIAAKSADYARNRVLAELLPFTVSQTSPSEQLVSMQPAEDQREHPILNAGEGIEAWRSLPPIYRTFGIYAVKPGATMLGAVRIQNTVFQEPLLVARSAGGMKSAALLGYGIWRWRLMAQDAPATAGLFASFLTNTVKWLTTPDERRSVRVSPTQESFSQGQPVDFTGQVYNQNAEAVDNAGLRLTARQGELSFETELRPLGGGRYEGSLEGLPEGEYTFQAGATLNGASLGEDRGRFSVGELDLEVQDTRMNSMLLRQLAFRTGGKYLAPGTIGQLDSLLAARPAFTGRTVVQASDTELWHWHWLLAGIIGLFALEWVVRKITGML